MANTPGTPVTLADLHALVVLDDAVTYKRKVRWAVNGDVAVLADGVARAFTNEEGHFLNPQSDVREACVWISSTMEHFLPVKDLIPLIKENLFVVDH